MIHYVMVFLLAAVLVLIRLVRGPTAPDRMVAFDTTSVIVIGILAMLSLQFNMGYLLDVAIMYALLTFVATIVLSRYVRGVI